jgi:hypothetical protein
VTVARDYGKSVDRKGEYDAKHRIVKMQALAA